MKKTVQLLTLALILCCLPQFVLAGGIDNKQNFSARYMATGSRNAATDGADIAAYNPAGIMQQEPGITVEFDAHYIEKDYVHKFTTYDTATRISGESDEPSLVPGLFATYNSGKWGLFGAVTVNGGGGKVKYSDGNGITNLLEGMMMTTYGGLGNALLGITENESIEAESMYITYTIGATYKINNIFSVGAGVRWVDAEKSVEGHAEFTNYNILFHGTESDIDIDYEESADGWGWVASVNVKPSDSVLIALRYESEVALEWERSYNSGNNGWGATVLAGLGKPDGEKFDHNLPALIGLGFAWQATEKLNINVSFTHYFEESADWDGMEDNVKNSSDIGISFTYSILDNLRVSAGYMHTYDGIDAADYDTTAQMSPVLDANSYFFGMGYDFNEHFTVEFALAYLTYEGQTDATYGVDYEKTNKAVGIGLIYRF